MRWALAAALATLLGTGALRAQAPAASAAPDGGIKAVASNMDVMKTMTIPFSNAVFEAAAEAPKDDAAWETVRGQAVALAEAGNLLMLGSRAKDRAAWMKFSQAQVDAAEVAARAAAAKNAEQLSAAADALYETCANCHKDYLPQ